MSVFFKIKKIWDMLHPSQPVLVGMATGAVVLGILLAPIWIPAALLGLTAYGIALGVAKWRGKKDLGFDIQADIVSVPQQNILAYIVDNNPAPAIKSQPIVSVTSQSMFKESKKDTALNCCDMPVGAGIDPEQSGFKLAESPPRSSLRR